MNSHCLRCRKITATKNGSMVKTVNGRTQFKGICAVCGAKKAQFVSNSQAKSGRAKKGKGFGDSDSVYADIGRFFGI